MVAAIVLTFFLFVCRRTFFMSCLRRCETASAGLLQERLAALMAKLDGPANDQQLSSKQKHQVGWEVHTNALVLGTPRNGG